LCQADDAALAEQERDAQAGYGVKAGKDKQIDNMARRNEGQRSP
jgi:hypothetical protein